MSAVLRFPMRHCAAVFLVREALGGWLVLLHEHGWAFGSRQEAVAEAQELARLLNLPLRVEHHQ